MEMTIVNAHNNNSSLLPIDRLVRNSYKSLLHQAELISQIANVHLMIQFNDFYSR